MLIHNNDSQSNLKEDLTYQKSSQSDTSAYTITQYINTWISISWALLEFVFTILHITVTRQWHEIWNTTLCYWGTPHNKFVIIIREPSWTNTDQQRNFTIRKKNCKSQMYNIGYKFKYTWFFTSSKCTAKHKKKNQIFQHIKQPETLRLIDTTTKTRYMYQEDLLNCMFTRAHIH